MRGRSPPPHAFRRRAVGMFALALMEREGPVHGYRIADAISDRTQGAWRPGPGSIYPSLARLVQSGLARVQPQERRKCYVITPKGRRLLANVRTASSEFHRTGPDLTVLWMEVMGKSDPTPFLLLRLRRSIGGVLTYLETGPGGASKSRLAREARQELRRGLAGLAPGGGRDD